MNGACLISMSCFENSLGLRLATVFGFGRFFAAPLETSAAVVDNKVDNQSRDVDEWTIQNQDL